MSFSDRTGARPLLAIAAALVAGALILAALTGCGGAASFTSTERPPDSTSEAWYESPAPAVRAALAEAMVGAGITIDETAGDAGMVVGTKRQLPYTGRRAPDSPPGPLPLYRVSATVSNRGDTHVRAQFQAVCTSCGGKTPFVWEYPGDVLRDVFEGAGRLLSEKSQRVTYPPRHEPVRWRPPRRS